MRTARLPTAFFGDFKNGILFGGPVSPPDPAAEKPQRLRKEIKIGDYKLNWFYSSLLNIKHISILLALINAMTPESNNADLPFTFLDLGKNKDDRMKAAVAFWDNLQKRSGVWRGTISELLALAGLDVNDSDNRRAANQLLFNDDPNFSYDIQINLAGGGIKRCRPVSIFKAGLGVENIVDVKINWFFAASAFFDFKETNKEEARVIQYKKIDLDEFLLTKQRGGWLRRSLYIWLSVLTDGFQKKLEIEWKVFEAIIFGYKPRSKRQIINNVNYLKHNVMTIFVDFVNQTETGLFLDNKTDTWYPVCMHSDTLTVPPLKFKKLPRTVEKELAASTSNFDEFWRLYPDSGRKNMRSACAKKWEELGLDQISDTVLAGLRYCRQSDGWRAKEGLFIPAPINWLKEKKWER